METDEEEVEKRHELKFRFILNNFQYYALKNDSTNVVNKLVEKSIEVFK